MELRSELYHYARRFLNIDRENVDIMLNRCEKTRNIDSDDFSIDISECVPCSFYDENELFGINESEFDLEINGFFESLSENDLLGYCISIQGMLLLGKYMQHYSILEF
jgi:hypothetical protein